MAIAFVVTHSTEHRHVQSNDTEKRDIRAALIFGVVMATIEMGLVLWLLYC